jgi:hypothetical protein
MEVHCFTN